MSTHIETIMRNSACTHNGWMKTTTPDNCVMRSIRIGSHINCNEDGLICDHTTEGKIKAILEKYNIEKYRLDNIHTNWEFSTQLLIDEDVYKQLVEKINNYQKQD